MMPVSSEVETISEREARAFFMKCRARIDDALDHLLPAGTAEPLSVHGAMRWSIFAGGKRLRPALLLATGASLGASEDVLIRTACALEMIHTYSLIHDDLPSMDDDELRRGRPTCHVKFGEATAILAGDALQSLAFQTIAEDESIEARVRVRVIGEVARASGTPHGMVAGQALDLAAESREVSGAQLELIHTHKTGALITVAARAAAIISGASDDEIETVTRYGSQIGLLFQITDDLLDVTATAEDLGKTPGKDARAEKATYPSLYGLEAAKERALAAHGEACASLESLDRPTQLLRAIADFILHRRA